MTIPTPTAHAAIRPWHRTKANVAALRWWLEDTRGFDEVELAIYDQNPRIHSKEWARFSTSRRWEVAR